MSNLVNFFISFDKLMKEKLVKAFYWAALVLIIFNLIQRLTTWLNPLEAVLNFFEIFLSTFLAIIALRLVCEAAIALFRINDNLSPDGGKSETADIDPLAEARKLAEDVAKKTTAATKNVVGKTKSMVGSEDEAPTPAPKPKPAAKKPVARKTATKTPASKKATTAKSTAKKAPAKKAPAKKSAAKKPATRKTSAKKTPPKKTS